MGRVRLVRLAQGKDRARVNVFAQEAAPAVAVCSAALENEGHEKKSFAMISFFFPRKSLAFQLHQREPHMLFFFVFVLFFYSKVLVSSRFLWATGRRSNQLGRKRSQLPSCLSVRRVSARRPFQTHGRISIVRQYFLYVIFYRPFPVCRGPTSCV